MIDAALNVAAEQIVEYAATGTLLERTGNQPATAWCRTCSPPKGDDVWVAIAAIPMTSGGAADRHR